MIMRVTHCAHLRGVNHKVMTTTVPFHTSDQSQRGGLVIFGTVRIRHPEKRRVDTATMSVCCSSRGLHPMVWSVARPRTLFVILRALEIRGCSVRSPFRSTPGNLRASPATNIFDTVGYLSSNLRLVLEQKSRGKLSTACIASSCRERSMHEKRSQGRVHIHLPILCWYQGLLYGSVLVEPDWWS